MKRPNARYRRRIAEQEAVNMTLSYLNAQRDIAGGVTFGLLAVKFAERILQTLEIDLHFEQIKQCGKCGKFYLKQRANQTACSSACSHALRQRKYRSVTVNGKSSQASTLEGVTKAV